MTYKLLDACLDAIARRNHNKTAVEAAMHGIKMELYKIHKPLTKEEIEAARNEVAKILNKK